MDTANNTLIPPQSEPGSFRLIATLGIAGFFSGLLLVSVFLGTQPAIQKHREAALQKAIFKVLPGCARYQTLELQEGQLVVIKQGEEGSSDGEAPQRVYAGYDQTDQYLSHQLESG